MINFNIFIFGIDVNLFDRIGKHISLTARGEVVNPGVINPETGEVDF